MAKEKGSRKLSREKAKNIRKGSAISLYVRNRITFQQYMIMGGLINPSGRTKTRNRVQ